VGEVGNGGAGISSLKSIYLASLVKFEQQSP